jgi:hypothetical protein
VTKIKPWLQACLKERTRELPAFVYDVRSDIPRVIVGSLPAQNVCKVFPVTPVYPKVLTRYKGDTPNGAETQMKNPALVKKTDLCCTPSRAVGILPIGVKKH